MTKEPTYNFLNICHHSRILFFLLLYAGTALQDRNDVNLSLQHNDFCSQTEVGLANWDLAQELLELIS